MKIRAFEKNSEEWLEYRKGKSGGSEFKDLYITGLPLVGAMKNKLDELQIEIPKGAKAGDLASLLVPETLAELKLQGEPKKRYYEIIAERVARPVTPNDYVDELNGQPFSMMARGHILEPQAITAFSEKTGLKVDDGCVVWESSENIYISPDFAITGKDGKVRQAGEVKCLSSEETIKAFLTGRYPTEYQAQVLKYFMVNDDLEKLYFVLYTDLIPGLELQIWEIARADVADQIAEASAFEKVIMDMVEKDANKILELGF